MRRHRSTCSGCRGGFTTRSQAHAGDLCKVLRDANQEVPKASPQLTESGAVLQLSRSQELESIAGTSGGNKATKKKAFNVLRRQKPFPSVPKSKGFQRRSFGWHEMLVLM